MASLSDIDLPDGLVADVIALGFAATLIQQTVIGAIDVNTFLAVAGPIIGVYAGAKSRGQNNSGPTIVTNDPALADAALGEPSIPERAQTD